MYQIFGMGKIMAENMIFSTQLKLSVEAESNRMARMQRAWKAYYGQSRKSLVTKQGQPDDNLRENFSRIIVDKSVSFLFGKNVQFEIDKNRDTPAEKYLAGIWQQNHKMTLLHKLALNGAVCGQAFIKIHEKPGLRYPQLVVLDPETVTVSLASDDIESVVKYQIQYPSIDPKTKKPIAIRQVVEQDGRVWQIVDQVGDTQYARWETVGNRIWAHEFPPIVYCQNLPAPNEFWGVSDIEDDLLEANDKLNFVMSNMLRILRYHGHPKTWGSGFDAKSLQVAVDETLILPGPEAKLQNLEMTGDLGNSIGVYSRIKEFMHELSRTPEVATGKVENVGALSGIALQILYQPLLEKTETKRMLYGDMLVELNRRLLSMGGYGDENYTELYWQEMLPRDPVQERQAALVDKQLGTSGNTLLKKLGYDPDIEAAQRVKESGLLGQTLLEQFDQGA